MNRKLVLIAHVVNDAVTRGFIPAGMELGYDIVLVTDHGLDYRNAFKTTPGPGQVLECDVFNPIAIIDLLNTYQIQPEMVFSNSDHLQGATALIADYFGLPGKPWQTCYRAKNKAAMRRYLEDLHLPSPWSLLLQAGSTIPGEIEYPVIAKPREGVASVDVSLCRNQTELETYRENFSRTNPGAAVLLEGYLEGPLFTLETLGDGNRIQVIGGFDVALSEPPHFVELAAQWNGENSVRWRQAALDQIQQFGVGFGVCHSEFIATHSGPVLVEINYRSIGDGREFLLNDLLSFDWFKTILTLHAGQPLPDLRGGDASALIRYFPATNSGYVEKITDTFSHNEDGVELRYRNLKRVGDHVRITHSNKDYLGLLTAMTRSSRDLSYITDKYARRLAWEVRA